MCCSSRAVVIMLVGCFKAMSLLMFVHFKVVVHSKVMVYILIVRSMAVDLV